MITAHGTHVHDLSSNGTFVNGCKLGKGNSAQLHDRDNLGLVPDNAADPVKFVYLDPQHTAAGAPNADPGLLGKRKRDEAAVGAAAEELEVTLCALITTALITTALLTTALTTAALTTTTLLTTALITTALLTTALTTAALTTTTLLTTALITTALLTTGVVCVLFSCVLCQVTKPSANLTCSICTEVLHQCTSLLPCLHNFCGGCVPL